jgi:hypothetical protein
MKFVIFLLLAVLVGGGAFVAFLPMSMAAGFAAQQLPDLRYKEATGSVWDGKLTEVTMGKQKIGDLSVKADMASVFSGKASGKLGLIREGFTGETSLAYPLTGGALELSALKLSGKAGAVPRMPRVIGASGGDFVLELREVKFAGDVCETASGEVWTDALARINHRGWTGPELRGPVTCLDGRLQVDARGRAVSGEDVIAKMSISNRLDMELTATVLNAQGAALEALTDLGFRPEGDVLVIRQNVGS